MTLDRNIIKAKLRETASRVYQTARISGGRRAAKLYEAASRLNGCWVLWNDPPRRAMNRIQHNNTSEQVPA